MFKLLWKLTRQYFAGGWRHFFKVSLEGIFWLAPIMAVIGIVYWLYGKTSLVTGWLFHALGLNPQHFIFLWTILGVVALMLWAYAVGHFMETRVGVYFERIFSKVPGYGTIKDLVGIFNSSKKGEQQVLVVMIKGFAKKGYNIGLMYSQKEGLLKEHYTVTLSQTPIPNGGYMFEVHADNIYVIEEASFDDNLQYLLGMGVKSITEILKIEPKELSELVTLKEYLNAKEQNI